MWFINFLSFSLGFLSLSLEILWTRLFGFTFFSLPQSFAFVLIFYLLGIALGANLGKKYCQSICNLWKISGVILVISSISDFVSPWIYALTYTNSLQLFMGAIMILLTAGLKAIIFPIVHHLGSPSNTKKIGYTVSRTYMANIFGSTLGPLFTGNFLLGIFTTQQCFFLCAGLTLLLAMYCFIKVWQSRFVIVGTIFTCLLTFFSLGLNQDRLLKIITAKNGNLRRIVENQYGIIVTYHSKTGGDYVTGGNVYDGRTNLNPIVNSNKINRLIILSALQDKPSKVLMIGLSIGTWLKILTSFPDVLEIDVIELNPGYLEAMKDYPRLQSGLADKRVHLAFDDGRHWLKAHPKKQYDLVIMNTTFYWRSYSTNLLSENFLQLIKAHMKSGSILAYNTTYSPDVLKTAATVFNHVYLYDSVAIAADFDWRNKLLQPEALQKLVSLKLDGKPLYPPNSEAIIKNHLTLPIKAPASIEAYYKSNGRALEVITDFNLITEYKYGILSH